MEQSNSVNKPSGYSFIAKTLHWGFVAIFAYGIYKQVDTIEQLEDAALLRFEVIFAAVFLTLLLLRFFYMTRTQSSSLPESTAWWQKLAAKIVHYGIYVSFGSIAASGILIGVLYSLGVKAGFVIEAIVGLHEISVTLSYYLIALHVLAAIYHRFLKDGVWSAMVPVWKED